MNRLRERFEMLRSAGEKALVGFVTAGDPSPEVSLEILKAMAGAGLDVLELGVPFSDPTADGPLIQRSSERALKHGVSLRRVLEMARWLRERSPVPIVVFSYFNPIFVYGVGRFHRDARDAGVDGVLAVDLPPEEAAELTAGWPDDELCLIRLLAPTTDPERLGRITRAASGFLYLVSRTGVTGSRGLDLAGIRRQVAAIRAVTAVPVCVGFGIHRPEEAAAVAGFAEGVVIGSAFEHLIEENLDAANLPAILARQVREFKEAVSGSRSIRESTSDCDPDHDHDHEGSLNLEAGIHAPVSDGMPGCEDTR